MAQKHIAPPARNLMMTTFNPQGYGPALAPLADVDRRGELGPGSPDGARRAELRRLTLDAAFAHARLVDPQMGRLCLAGVWLLHDFLDESHAISQQVDTASGSYWHGIMHRRELDYSNAKYWFNRVGEHPVFAPLNEAARELAQAAPPAAEFLAAQESWNPRRFVDLCQAVAGGQEGEALCREIARREWELLFDYCYRAAVGA
jgi:hypothetical protein